METRSTRHYRYDSLDVLTSCSHPGQAPEQRFYQAGLLTSEIHGPLRRSVMQCGQQLLGVQQYSDSGMEIALLGTDQQRSVLHDGSGNQRAYNAYGFCHPLAGIASLLGFNGERPDSLTGHYLLGSYRAFTPQLMRFNSPDNMSPFGAGGLNAYAYCQGNPINRTDPTGHMFNIVDDIFGNVGDAVGDMLRAAAQNVPDIDEQIKAMVRGGPNLVADADRTLISAASSTTETRKISTQRYRKAYSMNLKDRLERATQEIATYQGSTWHTRLTRRTNYKNRRPDDVVRNDFHKAQRRFGFSKIVPDSKINYTDANGELSADIFDRALEYNRIQMNAQSADIQRAFRGQDQAPVPGLKGSSSYVIHIEIARAEFLVRLLRRGL